MDFDEKKNGRKKWGKIHKKMGKNTQKIGEKYEKSESISFWN